jgi:hypothetical protein
MPAVVLPEDAQTHPVGFRHLVACGRIDVSFRGLVSLKATQLAPRLHIT